MHSLTFYQVPDIVASKEKLANFGSFGFASVVYEDIGYKKSTRGAPPPRTPRKPRQTQA